MTLMYRIRTEALDVPFENASRLLDSIHLTFLMGCPRSGTTFLLRCLAAMPRTRAHAGILIPDRLCHVIASGSVSPRVVEDLLASCRAVLWKTFVDSVLSRRYHLRRIVAEPRAASGIAGTLLGRRPLPIQDFGMVYKEPFMAMAASAIARHFPAARFIHLVRDGRDCAHSMERTYGLALSDAVLDARSARWREVGSEIGVGRVHEGSVVPWWVPAERTRQFLDASRYERYLWLWRECVMRARESATISGERYLELRYEELCRNPAQSGERLLDFLGMEGAHRFRKRLASARSSSIGAGSRHPRGRDGAALEGVRDLMRELGYE